MSAPTVTISELERQQADFAARLEADAYFADIGVTIIRPRSNMSFTQIQQQVDNALACLKLKAGKGGVAVQVLMPTADSQNPDVPGPQLSATMVVRVQEHPVKNMGNTGTGKTCEDVALRVLQLLHHFRSGGQIWTAARNALTPSLEADPLVTYDVEFTRLLQLAGVGKVSAVMGTASGLTATLSCATSGASIYTTQDGSYPTAAAGLLYTAPLTVQAACTLRAIAVKTGLQQSDVTQLVIS